jgi:dTDP-4-amino-4,6-dideoxygalactose transaminase
MLSEIGSNFWISPNQGKEGKQLGAPFLFGYHGTDYVWMSTGRSATRLVLQTIEERNPKCKKVALLPSFTCHTVFEPFMDFDYEIHSLPLNQDLSTNAEEIVRYQEKFDAGVVLVHRYFGFDTLPEFNQAVELLQEKGVIVIEDCTHCLYSSFDISDADYVVASIRKWCGVPDGGFAICKAGIFTNKPIKTDEKMVDAKRIASELKYQFLFEGKGKKPTFKSKYREAEALLGKQNDFYAIGTLSAAIQAELDVKRLKKKRRVNYKILMKGIWNVAGIKVIFDSLPDEVVPLYFPILVNARGTIQDLLADNDIYAPIVWPRAEKCPLIDEIARKVYEKILCIPVDQRYAEDDMYRIVEVLNKYI